MGKGKGFYWKATGHGGGWGKAKGGRKATHGGGWGKAKKEKPEPEIIDLVKAKEEEVLAKKVIRVGKKLEKDPDDPEHWGALWNHCISQDGIWSDLHKRLEDDMPLPAYEKVIDGENYGKRWRRIMTLSVSGNLICWPNVKEGATCKACNCSDHDTDKCLFVNFITNCHQLRKTKANMFQKEGF